MIMTTYIALLRGINVGGKNIIKMADLKRAFEAIGLREVQTYIQSGNVLFKSNQKEEFLQRKLERKIKEIFGFSVTVVLRTASDLERIIENCPFSEEEVIDAMSSSEVESQYIALLSHAPLEEKLEYLNAFKSKNDEYRIVGCDIFLLFRHSIRDSKLANNLYQLDVPVTVRNWKTINKLAELAQVMEKQTESVHENEE